MEVDDAYDVMTKADMKWVHNKYENLDNLEFGNQQKQNVNRKADPVNEEDIAYILCPLCQTPIKPNAVNLCVRCLNERHDISDGIARELVVFQCRGCERWYKNPQWITAARESAPLLEMLLKKISGINRREIKLIDAKFVWTEPHSRRTIVRVTIQKEVMQAAIVEKSFEVTFVEENQQCKDCQRSYTHHSWKACIQLRQKVQHKRTFLFLEQLILKYSMGTQCIGIKEQRDGIDFYFPSKAASQTFLSFLYSVIILDKTQVGSQASKRLISHDHKSNIANYKYTAYAELPPICRQDLVLIPLKLQKKLGGKCPLMICTKITQFLHFLDPSTLHTIELDAKQYFRHLFNPIAAVQHLSVFYVQHKEAMHGVAPKRKWRCAELELIREDDLGDDNAPILEAVTHLGGLLQPGDMVKGYDLSQLATHSDLVHDKNLRPYLKKHKMPDVIVVKKHYEYRSKRERRNWKLKQLVKEREYSVDKHLAEREQRDQELFMRDIEQDAELRAQIKVYRDPKYVAPEGGADGWNAEEDDMPRIPDEELIDEFAEMKIDEGNGDQIEQNGDEDEDEDIDLNDL